MGILGEKVQDWRRQSKEIYRSEFLDYKMEYSKTVISRAQELKVLLNDSLAKNMSLSGISNNCKYWEISFHVKRLEELSQAQAYGDEY